MSPTDLKAALGRQGYVTPDGVAVAVSAALAGRAGHVPALLVTGRPGTGKSALALALAGALQARLVALQLHAWSDADELIVGVNVPAAVAGDAANVQQEGALTRALRASQEGPVVLFLDELDKAPQRTEDLLLRFLQEGLVTLPGGVSVRRGEHRLLVVATSNATRPHGDALLRRCARVRVDFLSALEETALLQRWTGAPEPVIHAVRKAAHPVAEQDAQRLSAQELRSLIEGLASCADARDWLDLLAAFAARGTRGVSYLRGPGRAVAVGTWSQLQAHAAQARL